MKNQSGVMRLINCEEHQTRLVDCAHIHEARAIPEPLEEEAFITFNDGNNLTVINIKLRMERGRIYFFNSNGRWEKFNIKILERKDVIEVQK